MARKVGALATSSTAACQSFLKTRNTAILNCIPQGFQSVRSILDVGSWYDGYSILRDTAVKDKWWDRTKIKFGLLDHSPAEKAREAALNASKMSGLAMAGGAILTAAPLIINGVRAYSSHREAGKWDKVNVLFVEGLRHASSIYIYVLIEHAKRTQIAISSPRTLEILFQALIESGIRPSNIEDRSPEAFAALIRQKSQTIKTWKEDVGRMVS